MVYRGGRAVEKGTYWNMANGERVDMERDETLPGGGDTPYLRAPGIVVLLCGPVLGLLFAVFLPFSGIAMTVVLAFKKIGRTVTDMAARSMSFGWRPAESYLGGRKKKKAQKAGKAGPAA